MRVPPEDLLNIRPLLPAVPCPTNVAMFALPQEIDGREASERPQHPSMTMRPSMPLLVTLLVGLLGLSPAGGVRSLAAVIAAGGGARPSHVSRLHAVCAV
jgi:hypothetical protein